jgi:hypothetical protein
MFDQLLDFVKLSRLTVSTARRVLTAQITGAGDAGDDAAAETLSSVEVVQPLGLLAYPTLGATTEALIAEAAHDLLAAPGIAVTFDREQIVGRRRIVLARQRRCRRHAAGVVPRRRRPARLPPRRAARA